MENYVFTEVPFLLQSVQAAQMSTGYLQLHNAAKTNASLPLSLSLSHTHICQPWVVKNKGDTSLSAVEILLKLH